MREAIETDARWVLELAADLIERVGWTRQQQCDSHGRVCALEAIRETSGNLGERAAACDLLLEHLGLKKDGSIANWNDQARSRGVVIRELRAAAREQTILSPTRAERGLK